MAPLVLGGIPMSKLAGPLVLGFMWSYFFYGILVTQIYIYILYFPKDPLRIKLTVAWLFFLETLFAIFSTINAFVFLGSGWGDIDVFVVLHWSGLTLPILNGLTEFTAQSFYVWRIWKLTHNLLLSLFIESIGLLSCISTIYYGAKYIESPLFSKVVEQNTAVVVWLISAAVCDILITGSMVTYLLRAKSQIQYASTTSALNKLLTYTIETGMLTAVVAVVELILWLVAHQYNYHYIWYLTISRLYANALMATLNSRTLIAFDRFGAGGSSRTGGRTSVISDAFVIAGAGAGSMLWSDTTAGNLNLGPSNAGDESNENRIIALDVVKEREVFTRKDEMADETK